MRHILDRRIRLVLARLEMSQSYAPVQNLNASGSKAKPTGGDKPSGWRAFRDKDELEVPHLRYRKAYDACATNAERLGVCEGAEGTLKALTEVKRVVVKEETWDDVRGRVCVLKYENESPKDVARWERLSEGTVRKARAQGAKGGPPRHIESGRPIEHSAEELVKRKGMAVRTIVEITGLSHGTVQRLRTNLLQKDK